MKKSKLDPADGDRGGDDDDELIVSDFSSTS